MWCSLLPDPLSVRSYKLNYNLLFKNIVQTMRELCGTDNRPVVMEKGNTENRAIVEPTSELAVDWVEQSTGRPEQADQILLSVACNVCLIVLIELGARCCSRRALMVPLWCSSGAHCALHALNTDPLRERVFSCKKCLFSLLLWTDFYYIFDTSTQCCALFALHLYFAAIILLWYSWCSAQQPTVSAVTADRPMPEPQPQPKPKPEHKYNFICEPKWPLIW